MVGSTRTTDASCHWTRARSEAYPWAGPPRGMLGCGRNFPINGAEVEGDEERVGAADVAEALSLPICDSIADIIAPVVRSAAEEGWSRCMV